MTDPPTILPSGDGHHERADLSLIRRAIKNGWGIKPEWKQTLPGRLARIVADPSSPNREAIGAFQALRMADADHNAQLIELYKLENHKDAAPPPPSLTVNVVIVNNAAAELAKDPEAFRLLAEAAERLQAKPPE